MTDAARAQARAQTRHRLYTLLARAFSPPEAGMDPLVLDEALAEFSSQDFRSLRDLGGPGGRHNLMQAYQRLFIGPARPRVDPYESCYRDPRRRVAGPWAARVAAWYAREGLTCDGRLPDHIAAELAFMAHLAAREADAWVRKDEGAAQQYREQQVAFLQAHLLAWAPAFCQRLQDHANHPFYRALARLLSTWLELEAAHLGLRDTNRPAPAYPSAVVARLCTLCGICTEACSTGALRLEWREGEARLLLEMDGCTGCRVCADVCPFKALRLGDRPVAGILAHSSLLPCPDCGQLALSLAFWRRLTRRLHPSDPAAVAARRCPECKRVRLSARLVTKNR